MKDHKKTAYPSGIHTAIVTPFSGSGTDMRAFSSLLEIQLRSGVSGVVVLGTTGEAPTVSPDERETLIKESARLLSGKKALTVGCSSNDTKTACENVRSAASYGADYVLVSAPYYNRPSQRGILRHFISVADASPVPVIVYNVPSRTGVDVTCDTLSVLASHPNIAACKEAGTDMAEITRKAVSSGMDLFCGNDSLLYHFLCLSAKGAVSVCSNTDPDRTCEIYDKYSSGDTEGARNAFFAMYRYLTALGCDTNPVPIKTVMAELGLISAAVRPPLCAISEKNKAELLYEAACAGFYIK